MKPINKYIAVTQITEEVKTDSGLLLTGDDTKHIRYKKAKVVKPGTLVDTIKEGDVIYYDSAAGHTMILDGETYTIILERDVVVVL